MRQSLLTVYAIFVCLAAFANAEHDVKTLERGRKVWTEHFSDNARLAEYLKEEFSNEEGSDWKKVRQFKEEFSITDSRLRAVVMDIYAEAAIQYEVASPEDRNRRNMARMQIGTVVLWLGACADDATKTFLLDMAADAAMDSILRTGAALSYLRVANAEEAKDALLRYLIGEEKMDDMMRLSLYQYAQMAWHEANSIEKKAAILAVLYAALSEESPPWVFRVGDQIVQEMSPRYANSKQRLTLIERALAYPFPERRQRTKRELKERLEAMRKLKGFSTVNTNLAVLQARDFNQPLPEDDWMALAITPPEDPAVGVPPENEPPQGRRVGIYVIGGTALLALGGAGVLVFRKRHGASRP